MLFENALPGFREGKNYISEYNSFIYKLENGFFYFKKTYQGKDWKLSSNNTSSFVMRDWELYEEPLKELTLQEAVEVADMGNIVWNDVDGDNFHYYSSATGGLVCQPRWSSGHEICWSMGIKYFKCKWYEVKS